MRELCENDSRIKEKITLDSPMMQEFADADSVQYKQSASAATALPTWGQLLFSRCSREYFKWAARAAGAAESPIPTLQLRPLQIPSTSSIHIPRCSTRHRPQSRSRDTQTHTTQTHSALNPLDSSFQSTYMYTRLHSSLAACSINYITMLYIFYASTWLHTSARSSHFHLSVSVCVSEFLCTAPSNCNYPMMRRSLRSRARRLVHRAFECQGLTWRRAQGLEVLAITQTLERHWSTRTFDARAIRCKLKRKTCLLNKLHSHKPTFTHTITHNCSESAMECATRTT